VPHLLLSQPRRPGRLVHRRVSISSWPGEPRAIGKPAHALRSGCGQSKSPLHPVTCRAGPTLHARLTAGLVGRVLGPRSRLRTGGPGPTDASLLASGRTALSGRSRWGTEWPGSYPGKQQDSDPAPGRLGPGPRTSAEDLQRVEDCPPSPRQVLVRRARSGVTAGALKRLHKRCSVTRYVAVNLPGRVSLVFPCETCTLVHL
jgi:hypothetical protein